MAFGASNKTAPPRFGSCFVSHGGGPGFFLPSFNSYGMGPDSAYTKKLQRLYAGARPPLIIVVTAHWESSAKNSFFVSSNPAPSLYFDYSGFPAEAYKYKYPAPGSPSAAKRAGEYMRAKGLTAVFDDSRGYDHGVFMPLMLMFPKADIPVLMVSVNSNHDPELHIRLGEALAPFAAEGALILCSGMSEHAQTTAADHDAYTRWLLHTVTAPMPASKRRAAYLAYYDAPSFKKAHPRPEHFTPLLVAAGASGCEAGHTAVAEPAVLLRKVFTFTFA